MTSFRNSKIFDGISVLVASGIGNFSMLAGKVICKKVRELGGECEMVNRKERSDIERFKYIAVGQEASENALSRYLKVKDFEEIREKLVKFEWLTESIRRKERLNVDDFEYKKYSDNDRLLPAKKRKAEELVKTTKRPVPREMNIRSDHSGDSEYNLSQLITSDHNDHIIQPFERLESYYRILGDKGRYTTYSNVARTLKMLPFKVTRIEQLNNLPGIGRKTKEKIDELLRTGQIARVKNLEKQGFIKSLEEFENIYGVGTTKAEQFYKRGMRNIQDVKRYAEQHPDFFSREQLIGIKYYDDLMQTIPSGEIEMIGSYVQRCFKELEPMSQMVITGSYRRGRPESGDIDIVVKTYEIGTLMSRIVEKLAEIGLLKEVLKQSQGTLLSIVQLPSRPCRRVDIKLADPKAYPFMVLYFTGSKNYNRLLKVEAAKQGYNLGNDGLYDRASGNEVETGALEENDIIRFLGMPVMSLQERDI
jgi:DNA polymerase/3'-5' exonuclease PolX